jgi:hypothetical protein
LSPSGEAVEVASGAGVEVDVDSGAGVEVEVDSGAGEDVEVSAAGVVAVVAVEFAVEVSVFPSGVEEPQPVTMMPAITLITSSEMSFFIFVLTS